MSNPNGADESAVLQERARKLAEPATIVDPRSFRDAFVVFRLGERRLALEASSISRIAEYAPPLPLPFAPDPILGLVTMRGEVLVAADVGRLLGSPATRPRQLLVLAAADDLAIAVDAVDDLATFETEEHARDDGGGALIRGVLPDGILVVDHEALLRDPRLMMTAKGPA